MTVIVFWTNKDALMYSHVHKKNSVRKKIIKLVNWVCVCDTKLFVKNEATSDGIFLQCPAL